MPLVYRCLVLELGMHFNIVGIDINLLLTTTTLVVMKMTLSACNNHVTDIKPLWITNSFQDTATQSLVVLMHHTIEGTLYHPLPSTTRYPLPPATLYHLLHPKWPRPHVFHSKPHPQLILTSIVRGICHFFAISSEHMSDLCALLLPSH